MMSVERELPFKPQKLRVTPPSSESVSIYWFTWDLGKFFWEMGDTWIPRAVGVKPISTDGLGEGLATELVVTETRVSVQEEGKAQKEPNWVTDPKN